MNLENELLEKFQVEELEKRFEMGWVGSAEITPTTISEPNHDDPFGGANETYYGVEATFRF
jgi:hypothetical protein